MHFIAVTEVGPDGRLSKFQIADSRSEAQAFIDANLVDYPDGFVVANPSTRPWQEIVIHPVSGAITFEPPTPRDTGESGAIQAIRLLAEDASPTTKAAVLALLP